MEEEKDKILKLILGIESAVDRKSTLQLALEQARRFAGINAGERASHTRFIQRRSKRELDAVKIVDGYLEAYPDEEMDILTALSLYLIVIDQLGHIFGERINASNRVKVAIDKIKASSNMNESELKAIKELRNSINHNFGLASYDPSKNLGGLRYTLCFNDDGIQKPVVEASQKWWGNWCDKSEETSTHVYPFSLMNYIEDILSSYVNQYMAGEIDTPLCVEELKTRFTIIRC